MTDWTRYASMNDPLGEQARRNSLTARESRYGKMSETEKLFERAKDKLARGLGEALAAVEAHDRDREKFPDRYYREERARLVRAAQLADSDAVAAMTEYQIAAMTEARRLRSAGEASIDPAARVADLTEARTLAESGDDSEALIARARTMLEDGQPRRAAVYVAAARQRGGRSPLGLHEVAARVEAALDAADPQRRSALAIERAVEGNLARFRAARLAALRDGGLGVRADGQAGSGAAGEVAVASATEKITSWIEAHGHEVTADGYVPGSADAGSGS